MFDALKGFLSEITGSRDSTRLFAPDDIRLAVAALLVHVADSDGHYSKEERQRAQELVAGRFELDQGRAAQLIREAVQADHEEVGVGLFVNVLNRSLDSDARLKIVAMMWDVVFADGKFNDAEDSMVWRIAGMLGVPAEERETLRRSRTPDGLAGARGSSNV